MSGQERSGVPMVVSAPSGAGKTTLCRRLIEVDTNVQYSISYTTRAPRGQEQDGVDYHFLDEPHFEALIDEGAFLEWAKVHGHYYGTQRVATDDILSAGRDLLFDIDVQGGRQIAEQRKDAVLLFILPPSMTELERRLRGRQSDSEEQIQRRLAACQKEIAAARGLYDYFVVNHDLDDALLDFRAILNAERVKRTDLTQIFEAFRR